MQVVPLILIDVITIDFNRATYRVRRAGCGSLHNQASLTTMNGANTSFSDATLPAFPVMDPLSRNNSMHQNL